MTLHVFVMFRQPISSNFLTLVLLFIVVKCRASQRLFEQYEQMQTFLSSINRMFHTVSTKCCEASPESVVYIGTLSQQAVFLISFFLLTYLSSYLFFYLPFFPLQIQSLFIPILFLNIL